MKYDFTNAAGGSTFDGNVDFTLLMKNDAGLESELGRFRLTFLRLPAFPGAQGFGKWSQGGRGGEVYVVQNLNATGTGSLKDALANRKFIKNLDGSDSSRLLPRTVVFKQGGEIVLPANGSLSAEKGRLTIAGQSAPGSGIAIRNGSLKIGKGYDKDASNNQVLPAPVVFRQASDFNIRYLRVRRAQYGVAEGATTPSNADAFTIYSATRAIVDHCSFTWGMDGSMDVSVLERPKNGASPAAVIPGSVLPNEQPEMDLTAQWCIVSQTLISHSKGTLFRGKLGARYSQFGCFFSNNKERNPVFTQLKDAVDSGDNVGCLMELVNSVVYNWGDRHAGTMNQTSNAIRLQFLNNYYKPGPTPPGTSYAFELQGSPKVFFQGNEWYGVPWTSWNQRLNGAGGATPLSTRMVSDITGIVSASAATGQVNQHGGASRGRDSIDSTLIADAFAPGLGATSSGGIVQNVPTSLWGVTLPNVTGPTDSDNDGMSDIWERNHSSGSTTAIVAWKDTDGDGWTNLEEYLNGTNPTVADDPMGAQSSEVAGNLSEK